MAFKGLRLKHKGVPTVQETRYAIGDLYLTTRSENPSTRFGGTWQLYGPGRTLVCVDTTSAINALKKVKQTYGEGAHKLTVNETPSHNHTRGSMNITGSHYSYDYGLNSWSTGSFNERNENSGVKIAMNTGSDATPWKHFNFDASKSWTGNTSSVGGNQAHNNYQPLITCYVWIRVA